jgi:hypothetical protein
MPGAVLCNVRTSVILSHHDIYGNWFLTLGAKTETSPLVSLMTVIKQIPKDEMPRAQNQAKKEFPGFSANPL